MDARQLLPKEHVLFEVAGSQPREIFAVLVEPLVREGIVTDRDAFLAALEAREAEVTTQVGGGVAFPHTRSPAVTRLALVVGLTDADGVPFDPGLEERCRVFFLLAVPAAAPTAHLPLLRRLANFTRTPGKIQRLLTAKTPAAAARMITSFRG